MNDINVAVENADKYEENEISDKDCQEKLSVKDKQTDGEPKTSAPSQGSIDITI
jgi:hypothetical protein